MSNDKITTQDRNSKQDVRITRLESDYFWIKDKIEKIERQTFNHIPTQLKELKSEIMNEISKLRNDFIIHKENQSKWITGLLVSVILLLVATLINLFKTVL